MTLCYCRCGVGKHRPYQLGYIYLCTDTIICAIDGYRHDIIRLLVSSELYDIKLVMYYSA